VHKIAVDRLTPQASPLSNPRNLLHSQNPRNSPWAFTWMQTVLLLPLLVGSVSGQELTYGIVGGGSLTDSFHTQNVPTGSAGMPYLRYYSSSHDWIAGASAEVKLSPDFGIEVDGLFRKLHFTMAGVLANGSLNSVSPSPVITWEFPVLAKYRFRRRSVTPLIELGPSFRTTGNLNGTRPSLYGVTAGAGMEIQAQRFSVAPVLRYTRWAADNHNRTYAVSAPNQVELLVEFSHSSELRSRPFGHRFSLGAVVGTTLLKDLPGTQSAIPVWSQLPDGSWQSQEGTATTQGLRTRVAGPALEVDLPHRFSVEVDAIHHPLRERWTTSLNGATLYTQQTSEAITWELPVLAKYKFGTGAVRPLVELGPSFRLPQQLNTDLSTTGITTGAGIEFRIGPLRIAPVLRYTHWAADRTPAAQNQAELLAGISF